MLTPRELVLFPKAVNTNNIVSSSQAGSQGIGSPNSNNNPQAISTNSQGASTVPSWAGSSSQVGSTGSLAGSTAHAGSTTSQAYNSPQAARVNNPHGSSILPTHNTGNTLQDSNLKWIINLSRKPLSQAQRSVLAKGPNFVVSPMASSQP